jgi:hypothetical protein
MANTAGMQLLERGAPLASLAEYAGKQHGKVFCLVEAPSPEAAATVHREAHGLLADAIFLVQRLRDRRRLIGRAGPWRLGWGSQAPHCVLPLRRRGRRSGGGNRRWCWW